MQHRPKGTIFRIKFEVKNQNEARRIKQDPARFLYVIGSGEGATGWQRKRKPAREFDPFRVGNIV